MDDSLTGAAARGARTRAQVLAAIRAYAAENTHNPTQQELATRAGLGIPTIRVHLAWLRTHGIIRIGSPRREIEILHDLSSGAQ